MNVTESVRLYLMKAIRDDTDKSIKVLLMDSETVGIVTMAVMRSEMLQRDVFLFERLASEAQRPPHNSRQRVVQMRHVSCLVFLRPTLKSVADLSSELQNPRYGAYYVTFTNRLNQKHLKALARADEFEVVRHIQELFADFVPILPSLFTFNLLNCYKDSEKSLYLWDPQALSRVTEGLYALFSALGKEGPPLIRYQANSVMCRDLAKSVHQEVQSLRGEERSSTCLLILDRRNDPVTPLLNQWTYQAMVHELIGIYNNKVTLRDGQSEDCLATNVTAP